VNLIAATKTKTWLRVRAEIDKGRYPKGVTVPPRELARIRLRKHDVHGDWNYTISPARRRRGS